MSFILNIDTSMQSASVSISKDGILLHELTNTDLKEHSSFLQPAIKKILELTEINIQKINAVAVTIGPGSYTGLRVGMAAAKGICFALNIPLITINTLEALAATAIETFGVKKPVLICPMIDARRMEVYTALYTTNLDNLLAPCAMILESNSFATYFSTYKIFFVGSGVNKWEKICIHRQEADFHNLEIKPQILNNLSYKKYIIKEFADIAYSEPLYIKEFYTTKFL